MTEQQAPHISAFDCGKAVGLLRIRHGRIATVVSQRVNLVLVDSAATMNFRTGLFAGRPLAETGAATSRAAPSR